MSTAYTITEREHGELHIEAPCGPDDVQGAMAVLHAGSDWHSNIVAGAIRQQQADLAALKAENERLRNTGGPETVRQLQAAFAAEIAEWRDTMSGLSSMLSEGLGSDTTTASEFSQRIQHGINRILLVEEQRRARLEAELAAARVDAGRLDWLAGMKPNVSFRDTSVLIYVFKEGGGMDEWREPTLRAAIDAAMKGEG